MPGYRKLTSEEWQSAIKDFEDYAERGYLDPKLLFQPEDFDLEICYFRDQQRLAPIPEFRFYAGQFLTLFTIVLFAFRDLLPESSFPLECRVEPESESLKMVLIAETKIPSLASSGQVSALHTIGSSFAAALPRIFPDVGTICWEHAIGTGFARLWTKYPGQMTASGFSATSKEPFFGWIARVELGYPDHEQHKKSLAVLQLLADESATEA